MKISEAAKNFSNLVHRVHLEGISIDLENDNQVIARLMPVDRHSGLLVGDLNTFLSGLPKLGEDAPAYAKDVQMIRAEFPAEESLWD